MLNTMLLIWIAVGLLVSLGCWKEYERVAVLYRRQWAELGLMRSWIVVALTLLAMVIIWPLPFVAYIVRGNSGQA